MGTPAVSNAVIAERVETLTTTVKDLAADVKTYTEATNRRINEVEIKQTATTVQVDTLCKNVEKLDGRSDRSWNLINSIAVAGAFIVSFLKGNS